MIRHLSLRSRRTLSLRAQLVLLQVLIVLVTVVGTGVVAGLLQEQQLRGSYRDRMVAVAQSVARLPAVVDAFDTGDPSAVIQPIAEAVRTASNLTYVVVTDADGIRYSHPDPERIGERVSTDPSEALAGRTYVGTQTGTLGTTWRVKVPIFDADKHVIGMVSVGVPESTLASDYLGNSALLFITIAVAAVLGVIGAAWVSSLVRRRIFGLEPEQIAGLLEEREAMLHGVGEGLVAVDVWNRVVLINDAAARLLDLDDAARLVGKPAADVLDQDLAQFLAEDDADRDSEQSYILSGERVLLARRDSATANGRQIGTIAILRDNTELHSVLRDLDGANSLAEGLRAQAHGFANQLHVISGLLELGNTEQAIAFIARVGNGGTLSTVAGSGGIGDMEVGALLLVKQAQGRELGTSIDIRPDSVLPALGSGRDADGIRTDLVTIVGNLLDNALEACGHGGHIQIGIVSRLDDDGDQRVRVEVSDDGPGIPPELREAVFAPGYSSKTVEAGRQTTGRGIGLALVKRIARRHSGEVSITDNDPTGVTIAVQLRWRAPVGEAEHAAASQGRL